MTSQPPVKFNVRINQYRYGYADLQRVWLEADRLGYYSASLFDLLNTDALECWTTLTALLAQTQSIRAVPMVLANPYRHPALLAKMAATLDVISGGRITLGIGAGGSGSDTRASGLPWASTRQRCAMLEESVSLIRRLWTEPSVDFEGGFYRVAGASIQPKPVQQPTPPILVGGHGPRYVLPAIGRSGDIANVGNNDTLDDHRRLPGHRPQGCGSRRPRPVRHRVDAQRRLRHRGDAAGIRRAGCPAGRADGNARRRIPDAAAAKHPVGHTGAGGGAHQRVRGVRHPLLLRSFSRPGAVGDAGAAC